MNKKFMISIVCGVILLVLFGVWSHGTNVDVFETLDAAELSRISVYPGGQENTFTEQEDIDKIVNVLRSMRLNKTPPISRDGGLLIELYGKNGDMEQIGMLSDRIVTDSGYYSCDRNYFEALVRFCEERERDMIEDLGEYLNGELDVDKVKEISIGTGTGGKEILLSGEQRAQFTEIMRKMKAVEKVSPAALAGQVRCKAVRPDGSTIVIQVAYPYLVINDVWYTVMKEPCEELDRFAAGLGQ